MPSVMYRSILIALIYACAVNQTIGQNDGKEPPRTSDECQVTPVIHVLQYPGCVPKPIPSFACIGRCSSYLQVSLLSVSTDPQIYSGRLFLDRFPVVKSGRWNVHVCVVRSLANERQLFHYFARKQNQANENFERLVTIALLLRSISHCSFCRYQQKRRSSACAALALVSRKHLSYLRR